MIPTNNAATATATSAAPLSTASPQISNNVIVPSANLHSKQSQKATVINQYGVQSQSIPSITTGQIQLTSQPHAQAPSQIVASQVQNQQMTSFKNIQLNSNLTTAINTSIQPAASANTTTSSTAAITPVSIRQTPQAAPNSAQPVISAQTKEKKIIKSDKNDESAGTIFLSGVKNYLNS